MENARTALKKGMKQLNRTFKQSKSNHVLYLVIFACLFLFVLITWTRMAAFLHLIS